MHDFTDLRVDAVASKGDDSFWPSFTDIMTVIVMIFLIATSMLILQNWKLIAKLTSTMEAKQEVQKLIQTTNIENQSLEDRLIQVESQLSLMRLRMLQAQDENDELALNKENQNQAIQNLNQASDELKLQLTQKEQKYLLLNNQFNLSQKKNLDLDKELETKAKTINDLDSELIKQRTLLSSKDIELNYLVQFKQQNIKKVDQLNTKFSSLKVKYDKLFKPARSSRGKVITELRYNKIKNIFLAELKSPNKKTFDRFSSPQLHSKLAALKKQYGKKLYIKIIFPEDSGLSYDEAWKFTNGILTKYDYYQGK